MTGSQCPLQKWLIDPGWPIRQQFPPAGNGCDPPHLSGEKAGISGGMPRFYKGIGVGTFLHAMDLRATGISPRAAGVAYTPNALLHHIARGTTVSPCISLTRSFG